MQRFEITQTNLAAVADPEEVVLRDEMDEEDLAEEDALPSPPRAMRVHRIGLGSERTPVLRVVDRNASLALEVPPGASRIVLLALDPDGQVLTSRDLELATAMNAEVFLDLIASGLVTQGLEAIDLHVRVTPEVATLLGDAARKAQEARRPARPLPTVPIATSRRR